MTTLARKVTLAKWRGNGDGALDKIPADALTVDLKTTGNTLSFWRTDTQGGEHAAILALLGTCQCVETIDIVFINANSVQGATLNPTVGNTIFTKLSDLHVDIAQLDHNSLLSTATVLGAKIYADDVKRLTKKQVKELIQAAVNDRTVDWESIPERIRADLAEPK